MMKKYNYCIVLFLMMFFVQVKAQVYPNYSQTIPVPSLNNNGQGGTGGGTITINNNILTISISAAWTASQFIKIGTVATLTVSTGIPDMELGPVLTSAGGSTGVYKAKILNNALVFYLTGSPTSQTGCSLNFTKNLGCSIVVWYADSDLDGLGDPLNSVSQCTKPDGNFVLDNTDNCPLLYGTNSNCTILEPGLQNQNFIKKITYKIPTTVSIINPTIVQANQNITYFDGLGRPIQQNAYQSSNSGKNIVTYIEYDAFGRQTKEYLPFASNQTALNYINPLTLVPDLIAQNKTKYGTINDNPFSEKELESSPLNRILKQAAPGNDWALANNHTIKMDYQTNAASEVKFFTAIASWSATLGLYDTALGNADGTVFYALNQLYKSITYDENTTISLLETAGSTVEFKNKEGQVVLKRTYDVGVKHDTYYVYDNYGNLTYVIPPKADASITAAVLNDLCYQYKYDYRNRLVEKKLPGKQWEFIVYDKLDRVVAAGPSVSPFSDLTSVGWSVTKYDALNRPVITAWLPSATAITSSVRKTLQDTQNGFTTNFSETKNGTATNTIMPPTTGVAFRYSTGAWPTTGYHVLTVNYYDDYNFPNAPTIPLTVADGTQAVYYNITVKPKGLSTGNWIRILESSTLYKNETGYVLYDAKSRAVRTYTKNYLDGYTYTDSKIDAFSGQLKYSITKHKRLAADTELTTKDVFTYSAQDRLMTQTHQINSGTIELIASNTYDELGQLISKKVGNTAAVPAQNINYAYNIRGWMTGINDVNALAKTGDPKDLFGFKISYNDITDVTKKLYNGNISQTFWATDNADKAIKNYVYTYDKLNRLKSSTDNTTFFNEDNILYDKNGNITKLKRKGHLIANPSITLPSNFGLMDDLTYVYDNGNRLQTVSDLGNDTFGLKDDVTGAGVVDTSVDYTYDANGNMLTDTNKSITSIAYNHLNLPTKITFATSGNIFYIYNAMGQKVQKVVNATGLPAVTTDYLGGYQYNNSVLKFFPTAEGYVEPSGSSYKYVYQYKDHLGNVRLSYKNIGSATVPSLQIDEENNYYPFGLKHMGYNTASLSTNDALKYKFEGKEYQDELGLNEYAFGWRDYDPAIGRWNGIDVFAEKYSSTSPYAFCNNSPLINREIDGRDFDKKNEKKAKKIEKKLDKQITKLNKEIAKLQKNGQSIGDRNDRVTQLNKSKSDVSDMRGDHNNFYKFEKASQNNGAPETKRTGANEITMFTDNFSKQIHEGRHGGQIARGEYNIDMSGSVISGNFGVSKEIDAYKAQYSYDGKIEYVPSINMATDLMKLMTQGVMGFKQTISNMSQINNTFVQSLVDNPGINQAPIYPDPAVNPTYYQQ